jgi:type II secretory pathway pseudopilin PulG
MGSIRCDRCGFVSFASAGDCKQCGNALPGSQAGAGAQHYPVPFQAFEGGAKKDAGLAIASLVLGVVGLPTLGLLGVGAITGIVIGAIALARANQRPPEYGGRGLAIGGIVANGVALLIIPVIGIVAAIAIPNLLASRRAANEHSALNTIRSLSNDEEIYFHTVGGNQNYGTLAQLNTNGQIDSALSGGTKNGYHFDVTAQGNEFVVQATPVLYPSTGTRSFYYSSDEQIIRVGDEHGARASKETPTLTESSFPPGWFRASTPSAGDGREVSGLNP